MKMIDPTYAALLNKEATYLMHYIESMNMGIVHIWQDKNNPLNNNKTLEHVQDELLNAHDYLKKVKWLTSASSKLPKVEAK